MVVLVYTNPLLYIKKYRPYFIQNFTYVFYNIIDNYEIRCAGMHQIVNRFFLFVPGQL